MLHQEYANEMLSRLIEESKTPEFRNSQKPRVLVYVDPDIDGVIAARLLMEWLSEHDIRFSWFVNSQRAHGFFLSERGLRGIFGGDVEGCWIVHGDFTTTESQVDWLVNGLHINILSTDHHELPEGQQFIHCECEYEVAGDKENIISNEEISGVNPQVMRNAKDNPQSMRKDKDNPQSMRKAEGIVLNNQYEFEDPNRRYQSGSGVVLEVLRGYSGKKWGGKAAEQLVAWSLLSDVRDISSNEAHWWLSRLYSFNYSRNDPKYPNLSEVFRHVIDEVLSSKPRYTFGTPRITRTFVDFTLSPSINSLFRFDREQDAVNLFLGGSYPKCIIRSNNDRTAHTYQNWQAAQRQVRSDILGEAKFTPYGQHFGVLDLEYPRHSALLLSCTPSNFIGLAASQVVDAENRCILAICRGPNKSIDRASFRGLYNLEYRENLRDKGLLYGEGHGAAFGVPTIEQQELDFNAIAEEVDNLVNNYLSSPNSASSEGKIMRVDDMSTFDFLYSTKIAEYNEYAPSTKRVLLQYQGNNISIVKSSPRRSVISLDGVEVVWFGGDYNDDILRSTPITISRSQSGGVEYIFSN